MLKYLFGYLFSILWGTCLEVKSLLLTYWVRICQTAFQSDYHFNLIKVPIYLHFCLYSVLSVYLLCYPSGCEVGCQCGFTNESWCWSYFHMLTGHFYIYLEYVFNYFAYFLIELLVFSFWSFKDSLCVAHIRYLSDIWFVNVFIHSKGFLWLSW